MRYVVNMEDRNVRIFCCIIIAVVLAAFLFGLVFDISMLIKRRGTLSGKDKLGITGRLIMAVIIIPILCYAAIHILPTLA
ncbi:MAG: hypothetical protein ACI4Q4_06860 [Oscillospiraceae bacterium]